MPALTDALVKRLPLPASGNKLHFDAAVPGFAIRITAAGARSFVLNYETKAGRQRRITIGGLGDWSTAAARAEARRLRQIINQGGDPLGDVEAERAAPIMAELADRFEREHLPRKRPRTAADYRQLLNSHIRPFFGPHTKVVDVRFADVEALHHRITKTGAHYAANRAIAVLSKMFSMAMRWHWCPSNPAKGVERNTEYRRQRYLSADELTTLLQALARHPDRQAANIIRCLLMTGARRGEVLSMRWADLDLTAGTWSKPASSTKQHKDHVVPLAAPLRQLLSQIPRRGEFVFPGPGTAGHVTDVKRSWRSICQAAGITGLRLHDLRHSFASELASAGASLPLIGALLGHSSPVTTGRYAHLHARPQRAAVERVAAVISAAEAPRPIKVKKLARK
jgi:integrase